MARETHRRAALIVGVDRYEDPQLVDLQCAENDATEVWAFFKHVARYDDVVLFRGPNSEEVLNEAARLADGLKRGDLFVFYFAGHGVEHTGRHLLLCPKTRYSRLDYLQQIIPIDLLRRETERPHLDRVFILDACRSDLLRRRGSGPVGFRGERGLRDVVTGSSLSDGSFAILCSCAEGQQADEISSTQHGLFTAAMLEVLHGASETAADIRLTDELEAAVSQRMRALANQYGLPSAQTPWIKRAGPPPALISFRGAARERSRDSEAEQTRASRPNRPVISESVETPDQDRSADVASVRETILHWIRENDAEWSTEQWKDFLLQLYDSGAAKGLSRKELVELRTEAARVWKQEKLQRLAEEKRRKEEEQRRAEEQRRIQREEEDRRRAEEARFQREQEKRAAELRRIEEEKLWLAIKEAPTRKLCREYLSGYSEGRHVRQVQDILARLEDEKQWRRAKRKRRARIAGIVFAPVAAAVAFLLWAVYDDAAHLRKAEAYIADHDFDKARMELARCGWFVADKKRLVAKTMDDREYEWLLQSANDLSARERYEEARDALIKAAAIRHNRNELQHLIDSASSKAALAEEARQRAERLREAQRREEARKAALAEEARLVAERLREAQRREEESSKKKGWITSTGVGQEVRWDDPPYRYVLVHETSHDGDGPDSHVLLGELMPGKSGFWFMERNDGKDISDTLYHYDAPLGQMQSVDVKSHNGRVYELRVRWTELGRDGSGRLKSATFYYEIRRK